MQKYDLTIVFPGDLTTAKQKSEKTKVEKIINTLKGKVLNDKDLGKVNLAYKIDKIDSGIFVVYQLELDAQAAKTLPIKLKLEEGILRYLLIKKEK